MADELTIILGTIFSVLAMIIIIGCIRNCKDLVKAEKEPKKRNIIVIPNIIQEEFSFSEDPV